MLSGNEDQASPQLEQELRVANDEWARALAQRDGAALERMMAEGFVVAYPFEGDDKEQFIADVMAGDMRVESLAAHNATFTVSGGTGLVFGTETANWHYKGRNLSGPYRFIRVYTRTNDRWQIIALHLCPRLHH